VHAGRIAHASAETMGTMALAGAGMRRRTVSRTGP
jgi:hypothetical protein